MPEIDKYNVCDTAAAPLDICMPHTFMGTMSNDWHSHSDSSCSIGNCHFHQKHRRTATKSASSRRALLDCVDGCDDLQPSSLAETRSAQLRLRRSHSVEQSAVSTA